MLVTEVAADACGKIADDLGPFDISENSEITDELRSLCVVKRQEVAGKHAITGITPNKAQVCFLGILLVKSKVCNHISSSGRLRGA